ncbi:hypothetical protein JQC72_06200 [Polycladomyces sp. WAk]|uniref:Uncharacterized protein n=1 Tax=Polycladomyces zharkentensis TaxID=2807616 RepID=A0ABS2WI08_9BACL|nr:hypothetical protein [Polycladomyces sp. WAk]MBN2909113.1 hypothetical protein [Polycladomyces sp. WAk]
MNSWKTIFMHVIGASEKRRTGNREWVNRLLMRRCLVPKGHIAFPARSTCALQDADDNRSDPVSAECGQSTLRFEEIARDFILRFPGLRSAGAW